MGNDGHKPGVFCSKKLIYMKLPALRKSVFFQFSIVLFIWPMLFDLAPKNIEWLDGQDFDFGQIEAGPSHQTVFHFKNVSPDTLTIETVRTTCGCTAAEYTLEPVPPGGRGQVEIVFQSENRRSFHKKITVFFDKQKKAEVLHIRGEQF